MRPFLVKLYALTALLHLPFTLIVQRAAVALDLPAPWWVAGGTALSLAVAFHWRVALARRDRPISTARMILLEEPYFVHWSALSAAPLFYPLALVAFDWSDALIASYLFAVALGLWSVVARRRIVRVRHVDVEVRGLNAAFDGYRVAQMSDLHLGSMCPRSRVESWVRRVNDLDVDLVALTGDYVTSGVRFHEDIARALGGLRARDGVYAVMGNHDYYGDGEPLMTLLREQGITLLNNEHTTIERDAARLGLAGVDDCYTKRIDIDRTFDGCDSKQPLLVLAHDPKSFPELAERGADLVLSGHTHWGQIAVPWLARHFNYARLIARHHAGLYRQGDATLYVSPGLGTTGPPLRLGTWPEITVLELRPLAR
jgi:predicted MPP superfamily phosphohydrolase